MGCDIHLFQEVKRNAQWECIHESSQENMGTDDEPEMEREIGNPYIPRNYWLFGLLARVRTEWPFSFDARNLPADVSEEAQDDSDRWDVDGHSHSWLGLEELRHKAAELSILPHPKALENQQSLASLIDRLSWPNDVAAEDCRIVFWFDN